MKRGWIAALILLSACGGVRRTATVGRRIDDRRVVGHFVSPTSYENFLRGEIASARGDWTLAEESFRQASADAEDDALVLARHAHALAALGRAEEAQDVVTRALTRFPDAESLWLEQGSLAQARGDSSAAMNAYARAEQAAPRSMQSVRARVTLLRAMHADDRAHELLEQFARAHPAASREALEASFELSLQNGDTDRILRGLDLLGRVAPISRAQLQRALDTLAAHGEANVSAERLRAFEHEAPAQKAVWLRIAIALGQKGIAREWLTTLTPEQLGGFAQAASLALAADDHARALDYAVLALADESSAQLMDTAAIAALHLGRYQDAASYASRAIALHDDPTRRTILTRALYALGL